MNPHDLRLRFSGPTPATVAAGAPAYAFLRAAIVAFLFPYAAWIDIPHKWAVFVVLAMAAVAHAAWWWFVGRGAVTLDRTRALLTVVPDSMFIGVGMLLTGGVDSPALYVWAPQLANAAVWLGLGAAGMNLVIAAAWILTLGATGATLGEDIALTDLQLAVVASFMLMVTAALGGEVTLRQRLTQKSLSEAEDRARRDPLTGLDNHGTFHERLDAEARRAARYSRPLALAVFDLDHFKEVNETHGHAAGDAVLAEVARRLGELVRQGETLARTGGEEFAWILPETDAMGAYTAAERARDAIASVPFPVVGSLTLSAGVCDMATAGPSAMRLYELADGALYWAKVQGRNATYRYSPEVVTELSARQRAERLERARTLAALRSLARAVDGRSPHTREHSERVARVAGHLAADLGWEEERVTQVREAALLHDLGRIGVPEGFPHDPADHDAVPLHAPLSAEIAREVLSPEQVTWIRHHQERWAGGGRPDGLVGEDIPDGARIVAIANAWDEISAHRPPAPPPSRDEAVRELLRISGTDLWPAGVAALVHVAESGVLEAERQVPPGAAPA